MSMLRTHVVLFFLKSEAEGFINFEKIDEISSHMAHGKVFLKNAKKFNLSTAYNV